MSQDLQSLAELHPKRIVSSLAESPPPTAKPASPQSSPIDPNAT